MGALGGDGAPRVKLPSKPSKVANHYDYWAEAPEDLSPRCAYWVLQIGNGFRPNRRWQMEGYDTSAQLYGVYIWEYLHVIYPLLDGLKDKPWL